MQLIEVVESRGRRYKVYHCEYCGYYVDILEPAEQTTCPNCGKQ